MEKYRNLLFIVLLFISSYCFTQTRIPNISIRSNSGELVNIKDYAQDKTIILNFWATWCVPCIKELNAINEVYTDWQIETDVIMLAVSIDDSRTVSRVMPLVNNNNWKYEILFDKNQELKRAFNVLNIPYQLIIHNNKIFYRHSGYIDGQEKNIIKKIKEHLNID